MHKLTLRDFLSSCDIEESNARIKILYRDIKFYTHIDKLNEGFLSKRIFIWFIRDNIFTFWLED